MSGGIRTFKLANGSLADVPEDKMDEWMRRMDQRGVKFATADVRADMQVGEPQTIKGGDWGADEDMGFMRKFAGEREPESDTVMDTIGDAVFSGAQGVLHGWGDEVAGLRGPEYQQAARDRLDLAERRSPWASGISKAVGQGAEDLLMMPARLTGLAAGGLSGAISGAGEADDGDRVGGALRGGGMGAAFGGAADVLGAGAGWVANKVAPYVNRGLQGLSNEARDAALGGTAADFRNIAEERGLDYATNGPAQAAARLGLPNRFFPQSPKTYAEKALAAKNAAGAEVGSALDEAGQNLNTHSLRDDLVNAVDQRGAAALNGTTRGRSLANEYGRIGDELEATAPPVFTPKALNEQKTAFYNQGYTEGKVSDLPGSLSAEGARGAGASAKDLLEQSLSPAPIEQLKYQDAAERFGEASMIENMTRNRAASNLAQPSGGVFAQLTAPISRGLRNYGPDFAANMTQLGADAASGIGAGAGRGQSFFQQAGRAGGAMAGGAMGMQASGADANPPGDPLATGRGYLLPMVVADMARQNPQSLGPYYEQIASAMRDSSDAGKLNALLERLERDQQWSQNYLPQLRARTAEGAGY